LCAERGKQASLKTLSGLHSHLAEHHLTAVMASSPLPLRLGATSKSKEPPLLSPGRPASKRKANDLLRNYYGLGEAASIPASSSSSNRLDVDSDNFDAQLAFQVLLQEKGLSQLLKHESDLLTEIRELDGERQSLVYNHHHELVSATETIGKVNTEYSRRQKDWDAY
jgi:hypothetical protein